MEETWCCLYNATALIEFVPRGDSVRRCVNVFNVSLAGGDVNVVTLFRSDQQDARNSCRCMCDYYYFSFYFFLVS